MSTRAHILEKTNTETRGIYCHHDGYLDHVGRILNTFYRDPQMVSKLIALGGISSLGKFIGDKIDFDKSHEEKYKDQCVAYHRDRGEDLEIMNFTLDRPGDFDIDYVYMYDHTTCLWYVKANHDWVSLDNIIRDNGSYEESQGDNNA